MRKPHCDGWLAHRQGEWQPGIPTFISTLIFVLLTAQGANRGLDYITGDRPDVTQSLTVVEQAMPLQWWGFLFLLAAAVVVLGMIFRRTKVIIMGCLFFVVLYSGITWGLAVRMVRQMEPFSEFWRVFYSPEAHAPSLFSWIVIGVLCALCAAFYAMVNRNKWIVVVASMMLIVVAFIVATGGYLHIFIDELINNFPFDGWRTPSSFALTTIVWALFAWGTKVMERARRG